MLEIQKISKTFGSKKVLDNVSLVVPSGHWQVLFGPSGCGKTTLLRLIAGLEQPDAGVIRLGERKVSDSASMIPPWQREVGLVFQSPALWPHMTVHRNILFAAKKVRESLVKEIMEQAGLEHLAGFFPEQLSGGEARRVALARALAASPRYLLMDEPLTNLDGRACAELLDLIKTMVSRCGSTLIYVTHDRREAEALGAPIEFMEKGRILETSNSTTG